MVSNHVVTLLAYRSHFSTPTLPTQPDHQMDSTPAPTSASSNRPIPRGFTVINGPDSRPYVVPDFLVEWTNHAWETEGMRDSVESELADRGVSSAIHWSLLSYPMVPSRIQPQMNRASHWPQVK